MEIVGTALLMQRTQVRVLPDALFTRSLSLVESTRLLIGRGQPPSQVRILSGELSSLPSIEIDSNLHDREHDAIRDKFCESKGWKILRIEWTNMFNDQKRGSIEQKIL